MGTIEDLRRENERLKAIRENIKDMQKIQEERIKILKENKSLAREIKTGQSIGQRRAIFKGIGGKVSNVGKGIFSGLQRYNRFLEEQEKKQKKLNKVLKSKAKRKRR